MTSPTGFPSAAVESINSAISEICGPSEDYYSWESPRRFSGYIKRLHHLLKQLLGSSPQNPPPSVHTALKGIAGDLTKSGEILSDYRTKSRIYVLIHCHSLCASLEERTVAIGAWLSLLDSSLLHNSDLRKKVSDLSTDMQLSQFRVTENEERVYCTLQKEAQGRQTSKAVQSAIIMDLARALGTDSENYLELAEQIKLLKNDLAGSNSVSDRRILISLERIFDSWSIMPDISTKCLDLDFEEDAHISPFKNFLCPLTKQVMKDPVVLESSQTYERTAIHYWFERCIEDGRDPTCPVTGQVLKSLEQKPNIGLAGAIEEWVNRNIEIQIKSALQYLGQDSSPVDCIERALDNIYNISEEYPSSRYRVRNAGIVLLIIKMLKYRSKSIISNMRSKALLVLLSMAKDDESKVIMFEEGLTRLAIHSLAGSLEKEKEYAVKLLLEFSSDESYCANLASQRGALVLLSSMAENLEHPTLSNLAEEVLKNLEKVEGNVQHLAAAGRFRPLLSRLCEGTEETKIEMASLVGNMTLANNGKEHIARQGGKVLVDMLSSKLEGRAASLRALSNLSALDDNASILVDLLVLPPLTNILFQQPLHDDPLLYLKEFAASTIANIVSKPGHWELAFASKEGHTMRSEFIIHRILGLLSQASAKCQLALLQILYGILSSPQASDSAASHIKSGDGIGIIIPFLEHPEAEPRIYAFRLTRLLSKRLGQVLANELSATNKIPVLKEKLLDTDCTFGERSEAACILANLPISDNEVKTILGPSLIRWTVTTLKEQRGSLVGRSPRPSASMMEGLLGILLHFARSPDPMVLDTVQEHNLMAIFREHLSFSSQSEVKQLSALGLKHLSESARTLASARDLEPQPPHGFCASLMFVCGKTPKIPATCPVHGVSCDENSAFCLIKGQAIKPLADLLNDENTKVQITAVEALSTLVSDGQTLKYAVDELDRLNVVDMVTTLFTESRPGELQERLIWMVERFLRVENHAQMYSVDQGLVKALVEAFKHGNANTKRNAQDALTNLKQLSGISGKNSNQARGRRLANDQ
ncbi:U-box domain-containing protein 43-like [Tasmannia lanceolata]|uniref:U-box domain-containing protein 43-like n=1 Tax=Tasmannia lanceolata TaxID=3420 RepID=UPI00406413D6